MARTVDIPINPPLPQARAQSEVIDTNGAGGILRVADTINTLYEQKRGTLVSDSDPDGILRSANTTSYARYRAKKMGFGGIQEYVTAEVYYRLEGSGTLTTIVGVGSTILTLPTITTAGSGWHSVSGVLAVAEDTGTEYVDVVMKHTTATGWSTAIIESLSVYYNREKTTLDAVTATEEGYINTGFIPLDSAASVGEAPVSAGRLQHAHDDMIHLIEHRTGQAISVSGISNLLSTSITDLGAMPFQTDIGVPYFSSGSATLRLYILSDGVGGAGGTHNFTVSNSQASTTITYPPFTSAWLSGTLSFPCGPAGSTRQDYVLIQQGAGSEYGLSSICGYWVDGSY
jgi:hypothetical protein